MTRSPVQPELSPTRLRISVRGTVQGVGFRPFVFRLASELGLAGVVRNTGAGAQVEVEGHRTALASFLVRLERERPAHCFFQSLEASWLDPVGYEQFEILPSAEGQPTTLILPDIATCPECLAEIDDPSNRRHRYPFTNCTHCGPRFSIIESLPYDRANTTMRQFTMCGECRAEYEDPRNRRFHAQPNACPQCGPSLELWAPDGAVLAANEVALSRAVEGLHQGRVLALKGLGGFQLLTAACRQESVVTLRQRKMREEKPFALMFPSLDLVLRVCEVSALEARLLSCAEAPIVLLRRRPGGGSIEVAHAVAPGNPWLGVMLPYTPLHHLLLRDFGGPVVATSGNLTDEPICIDEREALDCLGSVADLFLVHNRPIVRHADDSIARVVAGREVVLRRARGYAPLPIPLPGAGTSVLAVGGHLKNTVAFLRDSQVFISQHIGDLETERATKAFIATCHDLPALYRETPRVIAADAHPDYASTRWAADQTACGNPRLVLVQHHLAHVLSCMAENEVTPPVLGIAWDGTGLGTDGSIWGGEFLLVTEKGWKRVAHLRPFSLPGGETAIKETRRSAIGLLSERWGPQALQFRDLPHLAIGERERGVFEAMLAKGLNCPRTSSMGRMFDAIAALLDLRQYSSFEGQAAMELEWAAQSVWAREKHATSHCCRFSLDPVTTDEGTVLVANWGPVLDDLLERRRASDSSAVLAASFHKAVIDLAIDVAERIGVHRVVLSGGCFQNSLLLEEVPRALLGRGFTPYCHQRVPTNDGGICLGQVVAALRETV